jgi:hypothetical protein
LHLCAPDWLGLLGNIHGFNALSHRRAGRASRGPSPASSPGGEKGFVHRHFPDARPIRARWVTDDHGCARPPRSTARRATRNPHDPRRATRSDIRLLRSDRRPGDGRRGERDSPVRRRREVLREFSLKGLAHQGRRQRPPGISSPYAILRLDLLWTNHQTSESNSSQRPKVS